MSERGIFSRAWMAVPDWVFRALGAIFFFWLIGAEIQGFVLSVQKFGGSEAFWKWHFFRYAGNGEPALYVPWGRLLYVSTYVLIAVSFIVRMPPLARASHPREIVIPIIGAFWPFLPLAIKNVWTLIDDVGATQFEALMFDYRWTLFEFISGTALIIIGNALDVWAYAVLCRSLSIVAEPRELKVTGPYRFVRHPVYLGQILAQGGVWIFLARHHVLWIVFYVCFVAMQLYRSKVEDDVLERAFGDRHREWKRKTFWFF